MAKLNTADIGFEDQIWKAADKMRGNIDASEYKSVVLGLIFLKYISDKFEARYEELINEGEGFEEDKDEYTAENIFYVPTDARWSVIAAAAHTPEIGTTIDNAMRAIEKENRRLKDILPKNFARPELDKRRLGDVVDLFTNIKMHEHGDSKDILGRAYEYCLSKFAEAEGKLAGEFYTPACIVKTLVNVLEPYAGRVYDPCCGSGGMFVQSAKFIESHAGNINQISVYGQDSNPTTWKMAQMKQKNFAVELLRKLIAEQIRVYQRTNTVRAEKFSEILANAMSNYLKGMLTNEEVIEELLKTARAIVSGEEESKKLNLSTEELAFYDAITKPEAVQDFYTNEQLVAITRELTDALRTNKTIDWTMKESARAGMRRIVKRLLKKYKYPPEGQEAALETIMTQCEMWSENEFK